MKKQNMIYRDGNWKPRLMSISINPGGTTYYLLNEKGEIADMTPRNAQGKLLNN